MSGVRKAYASKGDDCTFSRFVRLRPGETNPDKKPGTSNKPYRPRTTQQKLQGFAHPAIEAGRSIFHRKGVKTLEETQSTLVSGHNNIKIGNDVRKGKLFRGYHIFTLTLEERATCPRSCFHWQSCYGNNMPFARRIMHNDPLALMAKIERDIAREVGRRGRKGILVRLHALGDFFSADYVYFWGAMLKKYPTLAVFGFTAWERKSDIGSAVANVKELFEHRFAIRWSNKDDEGEWSTRTYMTDASNLDAIPCPEQHWSKGGSFGCGKCGLCWNTKKNIAFSEH